MDTTFFEGPWPKQWTHDYEVGRHTVQWRQRASDRDGIFAGAAFAAPASQAQTWALANDYSDVGAKTPGVTAVRYLENTQTHQLVEIDAKVLWKRLTLKFEIERDPPNSVRFRLLNRTIGDYRGVFRLAPAAHGTQVEFITWLDPAVRMPKGLILYTERVVMLQSIRNFLRTVRPTPSSTEKRSNST